MRKLKKVLLSGFLAVLMVMPVYAADWKQEGSTWKYQKMGKSLTKNFKKRWLIYTSQ